jgi:replicative DNA helicase
MPISLRLPHPLEAELIGLSARAGVSKSALIVRSIEEFMARHGKPSAHELYLQTLPRSSEAASPAQPLDARPHKQAFRSTMQAKQQQRRLRSGSAPHQP